jgi:N-acetylglucosamine kinase-like BadF-type ATPase
VSFFLGIDGGGSKTRCVVGDDNSLLGSGSSSSCKVQRVGEACARDALAAAAHEACVKAGISPRQIVRTCAGITGAARPEIAAIMRGLISGIVGGEIEVVGDGEVAFEDAFGAGPGVLIIAGTGSIAYGRNARGEIARAGGWGHAISDEGSGYWIGSEAIRAALRARDRGEDSILLRELVDAIGARDVDEFIVRVNANPAPDFAALVPVIIAAADAGDSIASKVLVSAGRELASVAEVLMHRLFESSDEVCVATHGGVLTNCVQVKECFVQQLKSQVPKCSFVSREINSARGALARARRGLASAAGDGL